MYLNLALGSVAAALQTPPVDDEGTHGMSPSPTWMSWKRSGTFRSSRSFFFSLPLARLVSL
jgi:hypothetical protein